MRGGGIVVRVGALLGGRGQGNLSVMLISYMLRGVVNPI